MRWPDRDEGTRLLARLGVPERDLPVFVEHYPDAGHPPAWWPLLVGAHERLVASMDRAGDLVLCPPGAGDLGPVGPLFGVYVLLSGLEEVMAWHARHGIPEEISWATLADLGRQVELYHRFHGRSGFDEYGWVSRHFRGLVFQLGRLQFERSWIQPEWSSAPELAEAAGPEGRALAVHIPESGPLSPRLCDLALASAPGFFARHFPDEHYRVATCDSWLLDEQLSEYLPPDANIVRFQRRFTMLSDSTASNRAVMRFVFYRNELTLDDLPQATALERAIVAHLRDGRDWFVRAGWLRLEPPAPGGGRVTTG